MGATLGGARDRADVERGLTQSTAHWEHYGFGYWLWRDRASGSPVARGGLAWTLVEREQAVEVGWAVVPERWGEGIATGLGAASLAAAGLLDIPEVVAMALVENTASRRVMEKLGMRYDRDFDHGRWGRHALYRRSTDR